jgi:hypothetical protein
MTTSEIIQAWKNPEFPITLEGSDFEIPPSPAGSVAAPVPIQRAGTCLSIGICTKLECTNFIGCSRTICE